MEIIDERIPSITWKLNNLEACREQVCVPWKCLQTTYENKVYEENEKERYAITSTLSKSEICKDIYLKTAYEV